MKSRLFSRFHRQNRWEDVFTFLYEVFNWALEFIFSFWLLNANRFAGETASVSSTTLRQVDALYSGNGEPLPFDVPRCGQFPAEP